MLVFAREVKDNLYLLGFQEAICNASVMINAKENGKNSNPGYSCIYLNSWFFLHWSDFFLIWIRLTS